MMHITQQQEQFSVAYVHAIASAAGYGLSKPYVDDDSIDLSIHQRGRSGTIRSPRLDLQLKCLLRDQEINSEGIKYALKRKNYDDLIPTDFTTPRILVILVAPCLPNDWVSQQSDRATILKYCAYWLSLRGMEPTTNSTNKTVYIPQKNRFTVDKLSELMQIVGSGGEP